MVTVKGVDMIRNRFVQYVLMITMVLAVGACKPDKSVDSLIYTELEIEKSDYVTISFLVEIADTEQSRAQGLMNRTDMPKGHGMLFVFPNSQFRSFWMKNTLIPLDIIYIDEKGVIGHIHHHAIPHDLTGIPSQIPAMYVLEINGGVASERGITVGDNVFHDKIKRTLDE